MGQRHRRRRVLVGDSRDNGRYLRTTWHREDRVFVVSTWDEEVCTAAVRVPVEDASELVSLLVDGLAEAVAAPVAEGEPAGERAGPAEPSDGGLLSLRRDVQAWVRHFRRGLGALISGDTRQARPQGKSHPPEPTRLSSGKRRWIA